MATDYLAQRLGVSRGTVDDPGRQLWDRINAWLASLSARDRSNALSQFDQQLNPIVRGPLFNRGHMTASDLHSAMQDARFDLPQSAPPPPTQPADTGGAAPTTAVPAGTAYGAQYFGQYQSPAIAEQQTDLASLAAYAGEDPAQLQKEYDDYSKHFLEVAQRVPERRGQIMHAMMDLQAFATRHAQTVQGQWQPILDAFDHQWDMQYGTRMPAALRQQLLTALGKLDKDQQATILAAEMSYVSALQQGRRPGTSAAQQAGTLASQAAQLLGTVPGSISTIVSNFATATPQADTLKAQEQASFYAKYFNLTGRVPDAKTLAQYGGADPQTQQTFFDNLPYNGGPGGSGPSMTFGAYSDAQSRLQAAWRQNYGRDPSYQEVYNHQHWSSADIKEWLDGQPSHRVSGMTNGVYDNLQQAGEGISTKLFGTADSQQLIQMFQDSQK